MKHELVENGLQHLPLDQFLGGVNRLVVKVDVLDGEAARFGVLLPVLLQTVQQLRLVLALLTAQQLHLRPDVDL